MRSAIRALASTAVAALVLAAFSVPAHAQTGPDKTSGSESPAVLGTLDAVAGPLLPGSATDERTLLEKAVIDQTAARREKAESLPVPIDGEAGKNVIPTSYDKSKGKLMHGVIDQYPENPRCYVAGQYIPAPPTCPN